jgi:transposase-like protein
MTNERAALGGMLEQLVELGAIEFRPEPLDAIVERRLKAIWTTRDCPNCDADTLHALNGSVRIWCGRCDWKTTYTRGTPFYDSKLAAGEFLVAFVLYADTLLSINQIAPLLDRAYKTVFEAIKDWKPRSLAASRPSGIVSVTSSTDRHRSMRLSRSAQGSKARTHRGTVCPAAGRPRVDGRAGVAIKAMRWRSSRLPRRVACRVRRRGNRV